MLDEDLAGLYGLDTRELVQAVKRNTVAMLSSVLNTERAIEVNIAIMRTFVKLRAMPTWLPRAAPWASAPSYSPLRAPGTRQWPRGQALRASAAPCRVS